MSAFEEWDKQNEINYAIVGKDDFNVQHERHKAWKTALEWVLEIYEHRQDMESLGWNVSFKDKILEELNNQPDNNTE